jgi:hypothetical protein
MYIIYRSCLLPRELERPTMAGIIDEIENERELPLHFYLSPLFVVTFNMMREMLFCDTTTVDTSSDFQESLTSIMAETSTPATTVALGNHSPTCTHPPKATTTPTTRNPPFPTFSVEMPKTEMEGLVSGGGGHQGSICDPLSIPSRSEISYLTIYRRMYRHLRKTKGEIGNLAEEVYHCARIPTPTPTPTPTPPPPVVDLMPQYTSRLRAYGRYPSLAKTPRLR